MPVGKRIYLKRQLPDPALVKEFETVPASNTGDVMGRSCGMDPRIRLMSQPSKQMTAGPALTVKTCAGDNLTLHAALNIAQEGDFIVVANEGGSARSIMDKLFSVVRATRCSISLTDGSGLVLHTLRSEGDGPDVLPGQIATEAVSGTNGIGTCLVEQETVTIIGAQHYCARHHVWSCTASPIRYEDGTLAGVLNVSIARESYHLHTRGMVEASAHAIAEQLHLRAALGRQRAIMEVLDEGILEVGASGEIHSANGRGLSMLGLEAQPRRVQAKLTENLPANDGRELFCGVHLRTENGELWAEPIRTKSGLISALAASDGTLRVARDCEGLHRGALVTIELEDGD